MGRSEPRPPVSRNRSSAFDVYSLINSDSLTLRRFIAGAVRTTGEPSRSSGCEALKLPWLRSTHARAGCEDLSFQASATSAAQIQKGLGIAC